MAKRSHTWLPFLLESSQIYCMQAVGNAALPIIKQGGIYHGFVSFLHQGSILQHAVPYCCNISKIAFLKIPQTPPDF